MKCNYKWYTYLIAIILIFATQIVGAYPYAYYTNHICSDNNIIAQALCLLPFLTGILALWFSMRYIHHDTFKILITESSRINFGKILFGATWWFILSIGYTLSTIMLHPEQHIEWSFSLPQFALLLLIGITLLPIQTTFEELLFRGYIYKGVLRYINNKWSATLFSAIIFAGMHLSNPEIVTFGFWTMTFQYLVIALIFGAIACWDNGTEITIGMHFANNLLCMVFVVSEGTVFTANGAMFRVINPINDYKDTIVIAVAGIIMVGLYYLKYKHKTKQIS